MKHLPTRLGLLVAGAAVALAATPFTQAAHASTCDERDFPEVCYAISVVCHASDVTYNLCSKIK
jgi:hypothetical protein